LRLKNLRQKTELSSSRWLGSTPFRNWIP